MWRLKIQPDPNSPTKPGYWQMAEMGDSSATLRDRAAIPPSIALPPLLPITIVLLHVLA
jgi:hypothetical protein